MCLRQSSVGRSSHEVVTILCYIISSSVTRSVWSQNQFLNQNLWTVIASSDLRNFKFFWVFFWFSGHWNKIYKLTSRRRSKIWISFTHLPQKYVEKIVRKVVNMTLYKHITRKNYCLIFLWVKVFFTIKNVAWQKDKR